MLTNVNLFSAKESKPEIKESKGDNDRGSITIDGFIDLTRVDDNVLMNALIAKHILGWSRVSIDEIGRASGHPWHYNFNTKDKQDHYFLSRRQIPDSIGKDFFDFEFVVAQKFGINAKWDGIAWDVTLNKLSEGKGERVEYVEASFQWALAKAAILASENIWNVGVGLSCVYRLPSVEGDKNVQS